MATSSDGGAPVRSVRVEDELWARAMTRAHAEGTTISTVLQGFLEAWADDLLDMPTTVLIWHQPKIRCLHCQLAYEQDTEHNCS